VSAGRDREQNTAQEPEPTEPEQCGAPGQAAHTAPDVAPRLQRLRRCAVAAVDEDGDQPQAALSAGDPSGALPPDGSEEEEDGSDDDLFISDEEAEEEDMVVDEAEEGIALESDEEETAEAAEARRQRAEEMRQQRELAARRMRRRLRERQEELRRQARKLRFEMDDAEELGKRSVEERLLHLGTSTMSKEERQRLARVVTTPTPSRGAAPAESAVKATRASSLLGSSATEDTAYLYGDRARRAAKSVSIIKASAPSAKAASSVLQGTRRRPPMQLRLGTTTTTHCL